MLAASDPLPPVVTAYISDYHAPRGQGRKRLRGPAQRRFAMGKSGLDCVEVGQRYKFAKTVGETDVTLFAGITGDFSDTHINDQYMKERSNLGGRIAHGALLVGYMSTASTISIAHVIHKEGLSDFPVSSGYDRVRFLKPVLLGDT